MDLTSLAVALILAPISGAAAGGTVAWFVGIILMKENRRLRDQDLAYEIVQIIDEMEERLGHQDLKYQLEEHGHLYTLIRRLDPKGSFADNRKEILAERHRSYDGQDHILCLAACAKKLNGKLPG